MFSNIGKKIKGLAKFIFVILLIALPILGILSIIDRDVVYGCVLLIFGPVIAWIASWFLYGFGELIDKVSDIERNTRGGLSKIEAEENQAEENQAEENQAEENQAEETPSATTADENDETTSDSPENTTPQKNPFEEWNEVYREAYKEQGEIIGRCEMCGEKETPVIFAGFEDCFGKMERHVCHECFSKRKFIPKTKINSFRKFITEQKFCSVILSKKQAPKLGLV